MYGILHGNSGCELHITTNGESMIVKKTSPSEEYNCRLKLQCKKQMEFDYKNFLSVQILKTGYAGKKFYFCMKYINGKSLAEKIFDIELSELDNISRSFFSLLPSKIDFDKNAKMAFLKKIELLDKQIENKSATVQASFQQLYQFEWKYIQKSKCHGDFTLENILCTSEGYYLIDFLDSFYDSWMIDVAKILQDTELFWHYRNSSIDNNLYIRLMILRHQITAQISNMEYGKEILQTIYMILLLNVLRIIPYSNDKNTDIWIENKCKYLNERGKKK